MPGPPCSAPRCRLVINGGEFDVVGSGPPPLRGEPAPRAEKRARQHAALLVLERLGYGVSFETPSGTVPGAYGGGIGGGGPPPGAGRGGGGSGRGPGPRMPRNSGLDARQARAAAAHQPTVSRDAYLASLNDELG